MSAIDDLVRVSGYSRSTVFRYLAGKAVRPAAQEAIRIAAQETGFRTGAGEPRQDGAMLIAAPSDFRGFRGYAEAVEGIVRRAGERGIPVAFDEAHIAGRRFAAVVLGMGEREEDEARRTFSIRGIPCVLVNRPVDETGASWVSADFRAAAAEAAIRLGRAGCRRIACFAPGENRRVDKHKAEGFLAAAAEAGFAARIVEPENRALEAAAAAELGRIDRSDGWLAFSDMDAMRVIKTAAGMGLSIPGDISVIGMNDTEGAAYFSPALTSVRIPFRACGAAAVDAALRILDEPAELSVKITMRHSLIERESCGPILRSRDNG